MSPTKKPLPLQSLLGRRTYIKTLGKIYTHRNDVYAVSPNFAHVSDARFLAVREQRAGVPWSVTEDLYSVRNGWRRRRRRAFRVSGLGVISTRCVTDGSNGSN